MAKQTTKTKIAKAKKFSGSKQFIDAVKKRKALLKSLTAKAPTKRKKSATKKA